MDLETKYKLLADEKFFTRVKMAMFELAGEILEERLQEDRDPKLEKARPKAAVEWANRTLAQAGFNRQAALLRVLAHPNAEGEGVPSDEQIRYIVRDLLPFLISLEA